MHNAKRSTVAGMVATSAIYVEFQNSHSSISIAAREL